MIKLFIIGIDGKMGRAVCRASTETEDFELVGGFDAVPYKDLSGYEVFAETKKAVNVEYDVIIDFSRPETLDDVITLTKGKIPVVLATTGYSKSDLKKIDTLSKKVPVFLSGNMSWGVFVLQKLVSDATKLLWDSFDVEIIEKHHNQKVDAPSGTANMLADSIKANVTLPPNFIYGREGNETKRNKNEVAIHAIRGGTVVGEHEVSFYGKDEVITISHSALSRNIFATGALRAGKFLIDKKPGLYSMKDMM
ncbi:MAG: 4-hydroxy-tetrahydrodipicolinate reductase [Firmicutes bacterium]|nr:4-hydroxy-tetrahydrodipicolinate reductase [Bacillota bacterium]